MNEAMTVQVMLERSSLSAATEVKTHAVVRLVASARADLKRPPLELLACLDVSGSMQGPKLAAVQAAMRLLAGELSSQDRLGVTVFSRSVRQVLAPTAMDAEGKLRLRGAVDALTAGENTNMSAGLLGALSDLAAAPARKDAVRRVLLFTDGHANDGIAEDDRAGWAALLRERLGGVSVSWFGFGEDHDADFLATLADQSRGNAYVARDVDAIKDAFAKELGGLLGTRAVEIELEVRAGAGRVVLLNDERAEVMGRATRVRLDDLAAEERKDLVFEVSFDGKPPGAEEQLQVEARWRDVLGGPPQTASVEASWRFGGEQGVADEVVRDAVVLVFAANAQRRARDFAEQGRWEDAARSIREAVARLRDQGTERALALAAHLATLVPEYGEAHVYRARRSSLKSTERAMSKQRSTGSEVDEHFMSELKVELVKKFRGT